MGAYLSEPVTTKEAHEGESKNFRYGVAAMQGWRTSMEDAHAAVLNFNSDDHSALFGVFDGHGGKEVARFVSQIVAKELAKSATFKSGNIEDALKETFLRIDEIMSHEGSRAELYRLANDDSANESDIRQHDADHCDCDSANQECEDCNGVDKGMPDDLQASDGFKSNWSGPSAGTTAVVAVVLGKQVYVANAGDSRCVLSRNGVAVPLTYDHKPGNKEEEQRIVNAGGWVSPDGRVNGCLALSRALGDMEYKQAAQLPPHKQAVTAHPDVKTATIDPNDDFLLLACDGIWDVLTNQQAIDFVKERLAHSSPKQVCEALCDRCLAKDTSNAGKGCDNMSVMIVQFKPTLGSSS